jgi:outer membrane protein
MFTFKCLIDTYQIAWSFELVKSFHRILFIYQVESLKMKKSLLVLALAAAFAPTLAFAEAGDWVVRIRAADVVPDEKSKLGAVSAANGLGAFLGAGSHLTVDSNVIPELDISYYITKNIAAELILAVGTRHDVAIAGNSLGALGNQPLGSVNVLPPTLTGQWHFNPDQTIDPYLGAGVNYTHSFDNNLATTAVAPGLPIRIKQNMFGVVGQAGVDFNLPGGWLINADVKYVTMKTKVLVEATAAGAPGWTKIDSLKINPWVFGIGIGHKF